MFNFNFMKKLHDVFMKTAFLLAEKSKCVSHHVGAVIVKDNRIISMGYNGTPPGLPNCDELFDKDNFNREEHSKWSADNEIHGELNALMFSAKYDIEVNECDLYTTISPCNDCLKSICMSGIKNVYYLYEYDREKLNPALLKKVNVERVPEANEIKEWVEKLGLLYVPKQRKK